MKNEGISPNMYTIISVSNVVGKLGDTDKGKIVQAYAFELHLDSNINVGTALIDMYSKYKSMVFYVRLARMLISVQKVLLLTCIRSKCGFITEATIIFERIPNPDTITWTVIISSYAQHGLVEDALLLFKRIEQMDVKANDVTLLCILFAFSHMGMVEEGLLYFQRKKECYGLVFGRVGRLADAIDFIEKIPLEPNEMIWQTLLEACRVHGNIELGSIQLLMFFFPTLIWRQGVTKIELV
uniref:Pentatricopeptide repeat-containing protein n=1 Tax=Cannabis sativa TaxID=3483 RepID=A0A803NRW9_CANSA